MRFLSWLVSFTLLIAPPAQFVTVGGHGQPTYAAAGPAFSGSINVPESSGGAYVCCNSTTSTLTSTATSDLFLVYAFEGAGRGGSVVSSSPSLTWNTAIAYNGITGVGQFYAQASTLGATTFTNTIASSGSASNIGIIANRITGMPNPVVVNTTASAGNYGNGLGVSFTTTQRTLAVFCWSTDAGETYNSITIGGVAATVLNVDGRNECAGAFLSAGISSTAIAYDVDGNGDVRWAGVLTAFDY